MLRFLHILCSFDPLHGIFLFQQLIFFLYFLWKRIFILRDIIIYLKAKPIAYLSLPQKHGFSILSLWDSSSPSILIIRKPQPQPQYFSIDHHPYQSNLPPLYEKNLIFLNSTSINPFTHRQSFTLANRGHLQSLSFISNYLWWVESFILFLLFAELDF